MDQNTLIYILSIAGTLILILLGVVAYFIKGFINAIEDLKKAFTDLRIFFETQKTEISGFRHQLGDLTRQFENRINGHSKRLDAHANRLDQIDQRVTRNETNLNNR